MKRILIVIGLVFYTTGLPQQNFWDDASNFVMAPEPRRRTDDPRRAPSQSNNNIRFDSCIGPDLVLGTCLPMRQCPPLIGALRANPGNAEFIQFLRQSNVICGKAYAVVCCPATRNPRMLISLTDANTNQFTNSLPTMEDGCGLVGNAPDSSANSQVSLSDSHSTVRPIVGGRDSRISNWPWIALIGYSGGELEPAFKCGGALISRHHVLTAAHCIRPDLTFVRLGEHDLTTEMEAEHIDVPVSKVLKHPDFNRATGHSDIALLYLDRKVEFSSKIAPICLPTRPELRTKSYQGQQSFVAGWGRTIEGGQKATVLQDLQLTVFANSVCRDSFMRQNSRVSEKQFDDAILCAGDLAGGKDTCQGDSGGPLMIDEFFQGDIRYHLIGVISYGIGCARPNSPGVYTRVVSFIDWIKDRVAEEP